MAASSYLVSSDYNNNIRLLIPGSATYRRLLLLLSLLSGDNPKVLTRRNVFPGEQSLQVSYICIRTHANALSLSLLSKKKKKLISIKQKKLEIYSLNFLFKSP